MTDEPRKNFPLPEGADNLSINQLKQLINDHEYLTHYVINTSYNDLKEIETLEQEQQTLKDLKANLDDLIANGITEDMDTIETKTQEETAKLLALEDCKKVLSTEFSTENIKTILNEYLARVKSIELEPLVKKIEGSPLNEEYHREYIEKLTKWNKMKVLFDSFQ